MMRRHRGKKEEEVQRTRRRGRYGGDNKDAVQKTISSWYRGQ